MKKKWIYSLTLSAAIYLTTTTIAEASTYTVKSGDTLWKIANANNISVTELKQLNNLNSDYLSIGQILKVEQNKTYTVKNGDTLWKIASTNGLTVDQITKYNNLTSSNIYVGQVLQLTETSVSTFKYTVKSGDTLWKIANNYKVTVAQLKSWNSLTSDSLFIGQVVTIQSSNIGQGNVTTSHDVLVQNIINEAKKYIGVKYVWGGTTPAGFDCSGFIHYVFKQQGKSTPRTVQTIWDAGKTVATPKAGDIVFFNTTGGISHAGIYIGNNQFIHAGSSTGVIIASMDNSYWKARYLGAKTLF